MTVAGQVAQPTAPGMSTADIVKTVMLCISYIAVSSTLIRFNKFLMHTDRFPFSMALTACHMAVSFFLCMVLYTVSPASFPGMANTVGKRTLILKWFAPIGVTFAIALYASNQAYLYCNVSFLQFMKEGNVIITFLMSCAVGLQALNRVRAAIILWIIAGSVMAISGEVHFVVIGFVFQFASQVAECSRAVMGEVVLSGGGLKLDPLSYTMFIAPTCLVVLMMGNAYTWDPKIPVAFHAWKWYLLPNAMLAFTLNVLVAAIIKQVSAVGFILTGVCKDIVIVMFSCWFFGEVVTVPQCTGFTVTLCGVFFWSYLKVNPESSVARWSERMLCMPETSGSPTESSLLTAGLKEKEKV